MPVKVLIVDDSILFRTKLQMSLSEDRDIQVIGSAYDAMDAMKRIEELNPDVVTLDVEMPKMNGIEFLKVLIPKHPVPVVVCSSLPMNALDALSAGAVDYVRKPAAGSKEALKAFFDELKEKVKGASKAHVRAMPAVKKAPSLTTKLSADTLPNDPKAIIAIGASTGGTEAIIEVIKDLPATMPGIVITQHMPANFTELYAKRLARICKMSVKEAADMDRVGRGQIILAAGERQMTLCKDQKGYYVRSQPGARVSGHCPSVDVLFDSVATVAGPNAMGVILTGMGADGARGITKMRRQGAYTIGQDKDTCVVYGMPMEAYKMGGVVRQLPLDEIGDELIFQVKKRGK